MDPTFDASYLGFSSPLPLHEYDFMRVASPLPTRHSDDLPSPTTALFSDFFFANLLATTDNAPGTPAPCEGTAQQESALDFDFLHNNAEPSGDGCGDLVLQSSEALTIPTTSQSPTPSASSKKSQMWLLEIKTADAKWKHITDLKLSLPDLKQYISAHQLSVHTQEIMDARRRLQNAEAAAKSKAKKKAKPSPSLYDLRQELERLRKREREILKVLARLDNDSDTAPAQPSKQ